MHTDNSGMYLSKTIEALFFTYAHKKTSSSAPATGSATGSASFTGSYYSTTSAIPSGTATQVPYPPANASSCGDWALVDNVCCPYYCTSNNESQSCTSPCSGGCSSPPSSMCKSGTMCKSTQQSFSNIPMINFTAGGQKTTVGPDENWHYSVCYPR